MKQSDLCRQLGVTQGALSGWETGRYEPDIGTLTKIAGIFDVSMDHLLGLDKATKSVLRIPVLCKIPAGTPIGAIEKGDGWEEIGAEYLHSGHSYIGLRVGGDSMRPAYLDGDILIVRIQPTAETGDDAVVFIGDNDAAFRRVSHTAHGVTLRPLNPDYEPLFFLSEEVAELSVRILGVAVEVRRKLRR